MNEMNLGLGRPGRDDPNRDAQAGPAMNANQHGAEYYSTHRGPVPYDREQPHWMRFFGHIADQVIATIAPHRVFDAGCAHGFLVEALWDRGVEAHGRDISDFAISQVRPDIRQFCAVGSIADPIAPGYDLVTCIEVLEHMSEPDASRAIDAMAAAAPVILFSSSPTDLGEPTHVNVRPVIWWLRAFAARGFAPVLTYDATFVAAHAMLLRRVDRPISDDELFAQAQAVGLRVKIAEQASRIGNLDKELAALRASADEHARAARAAHRELELQQDQTWGAQQRIERLKAKSNALVHELRQRAADIDHHQALIRGLVGSSSWRLTAPLRGLGRRLPRQVRKRLNRRRAEQLSPDAQVIAASPYFDARWYLDTYPDVAEADIHPAEHYLVAGASEGRDPSPEFRTQWYVEQYPDVAETGINPLLHYIRYGDEEGRPRNAEEDRFDIWVRRFDTLTEADRGAIRAHIARLKRTPLISVVMPVYDTPEKLLREAIESVRAQLYPEWELCIADDASPSPHIRRLLTEYAATDHRVKVVFRQKNGHIVEASNSALELATGEFVALMDHDDLLPEQALYEVAVEIEAHPDVDFIYSDEGLIDADGRRVGAYFKPDWNHELLLAQNMVSHLGVYRKSLVDRLGGFRPGFEGSQDHDLVLRVAGVSAPERIRHIPAVLYHWRRDTGTFSENWLDQCTAAARRAVADHLRASEPPVPRAEVLPAPLAPYHIRVRYPLPEPAPLVSIIVPTRDQARLLARCTDGLLHRTDYDPVELIVVDHDSSEPEAVALLEELRADSRVRLLSFTGPFNYSAINNMAVSEARGDVLVLLNNDVEVIGADWLREMVSHAMRSDVGGVGAKLLYPDGTIQHAGLALGVAGVAHSFHSGAPVSMEGYFGQLVLQRNVSAVTAACMALRRSVFLEAGGFDEVNLPVAFSDVDLCLRIRELGYQIIWTPYAELYHHEFASRGSDEDPARTARSKDEVAHMQRTWATQLAADPFYNLNFSTARADFDLAFPARRKRPWRAGGQQGIT